jgi:HEAT repeat protein
MFRTIAIAPLFFLATVSFAQEAKWIEVLQSDAPVSAKASACRELRLQGTARSVPALAPLLIDAKLSHEARMALESIPGDQAVDALRDAVGQTKGVLRAGILDSLGERRDRQAVSIIASSLSDREPSVVIAASLALGKIGSPEAVGHLEQAYQQAAAERQSMIGDGLLEGVIRLHRTGDEDQAAEILHRLALHDQPVSIRSAALVAQMQIAGDQLPEKILESLADQDALVRNAAATTLPYLSQKTWQTIVADHQRLPVASQALLLSALRLRGDRTFASTALIAATHENPVIAQAGIAASGALAGSEALPILLPIAIDDGPLADAAWQAIEILRGAEVDADLTQAMVDQRQTEPQTRLVHILVARQAWTCVPFLLDLVAHDNDPLRTAATDAVFQLAQPEHVPAIVRVMHGMDRGVQREVLEKAVMRALEHVPDSDQRAEAVIEGIDLNDPSQQIEFLPLLGRIGGSRALNLVQAAMQSSDEPMYEAGIRALANWPDASVIEQLADLAQTARQNHQRIWALRAMIRVSVLPGDLSDDRKLQWLRQAMEMAARDEERSLAVQRAGAIRTLPAFQFAASYLDHPKLAQDASKAIVELAHHQALRDADRDGFTSALKQVIAVTSDNEVRQRALRYLESLGH